MKLQILFPPRAAAVPYPASCITHVLSKLLIALNNFVNVSLCGLALLSRLLQVELRLFLLPNVRLQLFLGLLE